MFESASGSFPASPALLLSQMSDPTFLSNLCSPFLAGPILPDSFGMNLVENGLIPSIKQSIQSKETTKFQNVPKLVKIIIDNLGEAGLSIVVDDLLASISNCYLASPQMNTEEYLDLYVDTISAIPSRYRDDVLVSLVSQFIQSSDFKLRVLAVSLITLVRRNTRVEDAFRTLSSDSVPAVRLAVVNSLPNCNFNGPLIDSILSKAARDTCDQIRNSVASIIGSVSPHLNDLYIDLLTNPLSMEHALDSFSVMVESSGFEKFINAFASASSIYPEKCAQVLISCAPSVDQCEHRFIYKCAKIFRHVPLFITNLHSFSQSFENKRIFLKFFAVSQMENWRERLLYAQQAVLFVKDLGSSMFDIAVAFSNDEVASVRTESVRIFVELYQTDPSLAERIASLYESGWQQRLVLAKVIGETNLPPAFWEVAKILAVDSVPNVKYCLARSIETTPYFSVFFNDPNDPDIVDPEA